MPIHITLIIIFLLLCIFLLRRLHKQANEIDSLKHQIGELNSIFSGLNSPFHNINEKAIKRFYEKIDYSDFAYPQCAVVLSEIQKYVIHIKSQFNNEISKRDNYIQERETSLKKFLEEHQKSFPYISGMIADYLLLEEYASNNYHGRSERLTERKLRIDTLLREKKELIQRAKETQYQLDFLLTAFPALSDFLSTDYRDIEYTFDYKDYDTVRDYLSKEEYAQLSESERNQLALDRYVESHGKSKWQIGRDYELSVGYQYEKKGYQVQYTGSTEGLADLGRDLIAKKGNRVLIIQCKYWSTEKVIREKHIAQLFGTALCYRVDHPEEEVIPLFVTCTKLSDEAKEFARKLPVSYVEDFPFKEFPRIKCNIGHDDYGSTRIYHLPMDQQYDSVIIDKPGEFMAFTVKEAEEKGFRRAWRWHQS